MAIQQWHRDAQVCLNRGDLRATHALCLKILDREPGHADALFLLGMVSATAGRPDKAVALIRRAITADPTPAEYHAHLARCLAQLNQENAARQAAEDALERNPEEALTLDTIGVVLSRIGEHERAVVAFQQAVSKRPEQADFQFNLAASLKFLGDFNGAEAAYESAVASNPDYYKAHWALSQLRQATPDLNHLDRLAGLLDSVGENVDAGLHLGHALAKEFEDLGRYDEAFEVLTRVNARKKSQIGYRFEDDQRLFRAIETGFQRPDTASGHETCEPLFIVGMPRTGTTLVERILSSHSAVHSAGELQNFSLQVKRTSGVASRQVLDESTLTASLETDWANLGQAYLESTRPGTGHTPHYIDKMPLNFLYLGHIQRALPRARIICLRRNPMDTCLSNFRQLFALRFSYYNYAFDLLDCGRYFLAFDRLMSHWKSLLGQQLLEVSYEDLVADQAGQTRRLLDHCELEWEDECLAFEKNTAPVDTASAVQVRQPLYADAVERWRRYEAHLSPLKSLLNLHSD